MRRVIAGLLCVLPAWACRQDMHDAPYYEGYERSDFFADGRSARHPPEGTVARGQYGADGVMLTGRQDGALVARLPVPVTMPLLQRGRQRFEIYCAPCHGLAGEGDGMIVQRGYRPPRSFHSEEVRRQPPGHYFDVMTNGFGAMPDYAAQVTPADRWAIVAYIQALQLSQDVPASELPAEARSELEAAPKAGPAAPGPGGPRP